MLPIWHGLGGGDSGLKQSRRSRSIPNMKMRSAGRGYWLCQAKLLEVSQRNISAQPLRIAHLELHINTNEELDGCDSERDDV